MIEQLNQPEVDATSGGNDDSVPPITDFWDWIRRWPYGQGTTSAESYSEN